MRTLATAPSEDIDAIRGATIDERARLVLATLGRTPDEIHRAYRKLAKRYHPDTGAKGTARFQVINEAHEFLVHGRISKRPLLADDELIVRLIGRKVTPLLNLQKEREAYEKWRREHFYGIGVL